MKKNLQEELVLGNRPKAVCKDCKKRNPGCHSTCQDYISFKKDLEIYHNTIKEERKSAVAYNSYIGDKLRRR